MNDSLDSAKSQNDEGKSQNDESVTGAAALSICESLLIALNDLKIISDRSAHNVLADAAANRRSAASASEDARLHGAVADLIDRIMKGNDRARKH